MNKKGFTLIELLAVIVILAIIALIAVPIVLNMISNARKSAAKSSAYGYIQAIDDNNELAQLNNEPELNQNRTEITGTKQVSEININIKGKKPTSGEVTIENKKVKTASLCINNYTVTYAAPEVTDVTEGCSGGSSTPSITFGGTVDKSKQYSSANVEQLGLKGVVYLDPTDLEVECTSSNSVSTPETKIGCMKFYIYDDSGTTYKMILDHNTTSKIAYNTTTPYVAYENSSIKNQVDLDTTGWVGNPKLITANEIATLTNTTTFNGNSNNWFFLDGTGTNKQTQSSSNRGANPYAWLFNYTNGCTNYGCDTASSTNYGYWTSSAVSDVPNSAWRVGLDGNIYGKTDSHSVNDANYYGIRPVITINKSVLD